MEFLIPDFEGHSIKGEQAHYCEDRSIDVMRICPSLHGGALDHPKITSQCIGEVVQKWDFCFDKVKIELAKYEKAPVTNSDEEVYEKLTGLKIRENASNCPSDHNSREILSLCHEKICMFRLSDCFSNVPRQIFFIKKGKYFSVQGQKCLEIAKKKIKKI